MTDFTPRTPAVFVGVDARSAVTHYRTMLPAMATGSSMYVRTSDLDKMKLVGTRSAPVVVYSTPRSTEMYDECIQILADPTRALIVDLDDCMRAVVEDEHHPSAADYKDILDKHEWLVGAADAVTVSTHFLAAYAKDCGAKHVFVIPNALDIERWNIKREPRHRDKIVLGFSGSVGHEKAWEAYAPALTELMLRREEFVFVTAGRKHGAAYFPVELQHRIKDLGYFPLTGHPYILTQFHINLGPTLDTAFYDAKSDLRALEAFASDSVFIGGDTTYGAFEQMGDEPPAIVISSPEEMVEQIEWVTDRPKLNHDLRKRGAKYLREERLIEHTAPMWDAVIDAVMPSGA